MNILQFIRVMARVIDASLFEKGAVVRVNRHAELFDRPGRLAEIKSAFAIVLCDMEVAEFDAFMEAALTPSARRIGHLFLAIPFGSPTSWRPVRVVTDERRSAEALTLHALERFLTTIDVHVQVAAVRRTNRPIPLGPRIIATPKRSDDSFN